MKKVYITLFLILNVVGIYILTARVNSYLGLKKEDQELNRKLKNLISKNQDKEYFIKKINENNLEIILKHLRSNLPIAIKGETIYTFSE